MLIAFVAAVAGDNLGFYLGRRFARPRLAAGKWFLFLTPERMRVAEVYFHRYGLPDQAAFRIDYPRFREELTPTTQAALDLLVAGWGTGAAAARLGVTPARVSQLRRELADRWAAFHGGPG